MQARGHKRRCVGSITAEAARGGQESAGAGARAGAAVEAALGSRSCAGQEEEAAAAPARRCDVVRESTWLGFYLNSCFVNHLVHELFGSHPHASAVERYDRMIAWCASYKNWFC